MLDIIIFPFFKNLLADVALSIAPSPGFSKRLSYMDLFIKL